MAPVINGMYLQKTTPNQLMINQVLLFVSYNFTYPTCTKLSCVVAFFLSFLINSQDNVNFFLLLTAAPIFFYEQNFEDFSSTSADIPLGWFIPITSVKHLKDLNITQN